MSEIAAAQQTPLIGLTDLSCSFGGVIALDGVDFTVGRREIIGLIGPNGSGKTTLLNVLSGIYRPTGGRLEIDGRSVNFPSSRKLSRDHGLARTFQNIRLCPSLSVLDNVLIGMHAHFRWWNALTPRNVGREAAMRRRADEILEFVGIADKRDAMATEIAYGDQRRVEIARALATDPRILLLDEPAAGMNPKEARQLVSLVQQIFAELDVSIVVIEHDMHVVMNTAMRVVVLDAGKCISEGSPREVSADERVLEAYLGKRFKDVV